MRYRRRLVNSSSGAADARAVAAHGQHSQVRRSWRSARKLSGRIHIVLIRQAVGF